MPAAAAHRSGLFSPSGSSGGIVVYAWAICLYGAAQFFLSGEKVFEERVFDRFERLRPMRMFCWTLCTQFVLGWALYPIQTVPALGGLTLAGIPSVVRDGVLCTVGISTSTNACTPAHAHSHSRTRARALRTGSTANSATSRLTRPRTQWVV